MAVETFNTDIEAQLGDEAEYLLQHRSETFPKESLHLPGPDFVDRVVVHSDRNVQTLRNLQGLFSHGRLGGTGYVSILPVDQGIEHSAGASFAPNPEYFDPEKIVELAVEGGCNAVASTFGVLGMVARKWATKIPFIVKLNHNEMLSYPNTYDQTMFGNVHRAWDMGATGVGATIYWGSAESRRQLRRDLRGLLGGARPRHVHRALVLRAQLGLQAERHRLLARRRPHRPGQPPRRHDRGRHHQAEAAGEQRRLHGDRASARPTTSSTPSSRPTTRSTSAATRSRAATWAARA